jgi:hypothetical protein
MRLALDLTRERVEQQALFDGQGIDPLGEPGEHHRRLRTAARVGEFAPNVGSVFFEFQFGVGTTANGLDPLGVALDGEQYDLVVQDSVRRPFRGGDRHLIHGYDDCPAQLGNELLIGGRSSATAQGEDRQEKGKRAHASVLRGLCTKTMPGLEPMGNKPGPTSSVDRGLVFSPGPFTKGHHMFTKSLSVLVFVAVSALATAAVRQPITDPIIAKHTWKSAFTGVVTSIIPTMANGMDLRGCQLNVKLTGVQEPWNDSADTPVKVGDSIGYSAFDSDADGFEPIYRNGIKATTAQIVEGDRISRMVCVDDRGDAPASYLDVIENTRRINPNDKP